MESSFFARSPAAKQWQQVQIRHHHGLVIPLFSLHSAHSCGIGEYPDLIPILDWCQSIGFDVVQLLPLNDTGWGTSPYSALSAIALNPIHLGLSSLPYFSEYPELMDEFKAIPKMPYISHVNYLPVRENKEKFLRHYYQLTRQRIMDSKEYRKFLEKSGHWLPGYALYKALKQKYNWTSWEAWPPEAQSPTLDQFQELLVQHRDEMDYQCFIQYLCDKQLHAAKEYASARHLYLMGDIPILIGRDSADVWLHRPLFRLDYSAGAPPDMFNSEGQNWGFPLYNWEAMEADHFDWWRDRLKSASRYYHLYRIDHIVGFFRIWAIPYGLTAKDGHFIPSDSATWIDHGRKIMLMMLDKCDLLPIGEDLGIVPPEVRACLSSLGICGTKVMRWERDWHHDRNYIPFDQYPIDSMTTVSTHDSETLQLWWKNNPDDVKLFAHFKGWEYTPTLSPEHQRAILWDSHHSSSLFHINLLQEYLAIFPGMTGADLEDERINVPGILSDKNWSYRFRLSIEELTTNQPLQNLMKEITA